MLEAVQSLTITVLFTVLRHAWWFHKLNPNLLESIRLYDTCGIYNLRGIPGILSGIWSALIVAFYNLGYDSAVGAKYSTGNSLNMNPNCIYQGGLKIAGIFTSLCMGLGFSLTGGFMGWIFYTNNKKYFYIDSKYC